MSGPTQKAMLEGLAGMEKKALQKLMTETVEGKPALEVMQKVLSHVPESMASDAAKLFSKVDADAAKVLRPTLVATRRMGVPNATALVQNNLGFALFGLGQLEEAIAMEHEAAAAFRQVGNKRLEAASRLYLARFYLAAGQIAEAEAEARESVALAETTLPSLAQAQAIEGMTPAAATLLLAIVRRGALRKAG